MMKWQRLWPYGVKRMAWESGISTNTLQVISEELNPLASVDQFELPFTHINIHHISIFQPKNNNNNNNNK
jgi:hypothetical protein